MVTVHNFKGSTIRCVRDSDSFGFPLAFIDGTITKEEYDIHYVEGDYRESIDTKEVTLDFKELRIKSGSLSKKLTTTLHRQLEGDITVLPVSNGQNWYLPRPGWYSRKPSWGGYIYYCRIYIIDRFVGKFYISHRLRDDVIAVDWSSWCYRQHTDQLNLVDRYSPQFEGVSFWKWQSTTPNGGIYNSMLSDGTLASAKAAIEFALGFMTSPVPAYNPEQSLVTRSITPVTVDYEGLLSLSNLRYRKLPYVDQCYLAQRAYQSIGYIDNNGIAFVHDLLEFRSLLTGMADTIKATLRSSNNKKRVQAAAQTYLAEHYGLRLMFADIKSYVSRIRQLATSDQLYSDRRCSSSLDLSSESGWTGVARYACYYSYESESDFENFSEILRLLDAVPSLENIWDLMPWTFVIDWFISLGDELTALDNSIVLATAYTVKGWTITCDVERQIQSDSTDLPLDIDLTEHYFSRRVGKVPILPLPPINVAQSTSSPLDHFVEGAALVVTNR